MEIVGLDHVQVIAPRRPESDAEARAFYGALLGLEEIEKPESLRARGGVWFAAGSGQLHVGLEDAFAPARRAHPALRVRNLDALREHLESAGVEITSAEPIPGIERVYVTDPFGNRIEMLEVLHSPGRRAKDKPLGASLGWEIIATSYPVETNWLRLREDRVKRNGEELTFTYVESDGAVGIVPVTRDGQIALIRQYRFTVDEWTYEIPAGGMHDADEEASAEEIARKELAEEIGARCEELVEISSFFDAIGSGDQTFHVYLALGVVLDLDTEHEPTEVIETHLLPAREAVRMAGAGEIRDCSSALSILLCVPALRERGYLD